LKSEEILAQVALAILLDRAEAGLDRKIDVVVGGRESTNPSGDAAKARR